MNKVILIGNLANDPEPFTTQSGISRSTFRVAVQRRFANAQGVREAHSQRRIDPWMRHRRGGLVIDAHVR